MMDEVFSEIIPKEPDDQEEENVILAEEDIDADPLTGDENDNADSSNVHEDDSKSEVKVASSGLINI